MTALPTPAFAAVQHGYSLSILASTGNPEGLAVDATGDVYVATGGTVDRIAPSGAVTVVAGNGSSGAPVAGPATSSPLTSSGVAVGADGNLYIADGSYVVKVDSTGNLTIVAGNGMYGAPVPGPATSSPMATVAVATDNANDVFVADQYGHVAKVTPSGSLTIIAGNGVGGGTGQLPALPAPARSVPIFPTGLAVDSHGDVLIADRGYQGQWGGRPGYVEKVTPSGTLSIIGGDPQGWDSSAFPPVPGAPATSGPMEPPAGVAVDSSGDVFVATAADGGASGFVDEIDPSGTLTVVAGNYGADGAPITGAAGSSPIQPKGIAVGQDGQVFASTQDTAGYNCCIVIAHDVVAMATMPTYSQLQSPSISGSGRVNQTLTVSPGSTSPAYGSVSYQWYSNRSITGTPFPISGATGATYTPPNLEQGTQITVRVTYSGPGYATTNVMTAGRNVQTCLMPTQLPNISGTAAVYGTLKATPGSTYPAATGVHYQWVEKRIGSGNYGPIQHATSATYVLQPLDEGASVYVLVTYDPPSDCYLTYATARVPKPIAPAVNFTGYVHGTVSVHGTAWVAASVPAGSRVSYAWKIGNSYINWNHPAYTFPWSSYGKQVLVKILVATPYGTAYSKYYNAGTVQPPA